MEQKEMKMGTPIAIIVAGLLITGAIIGTNALKGKSSPAETETLQSVPPVTVADHIYGNKDAEIAIIEYSDTDCPFCAEFHKTLKDIVTKNDNVMWVYRHLPLTTLHPQADTEAHAAECTAELAGETAFWSYLDTLFALELSKYPEQKIVLSANAVGLGIDKNAFDSCMESNRYTATIATQAADGKKAGGKGTPFTIFINRSGTQVPLLGYDTPENVQTIIDSLSQ